MPERRSAPRTPPIGLSEGRCFTAIAFIRKLVPNLHRQAVLRVSLSFSLLCRFDLGIGHPGMAACGTGDLGVMLRHLSQKDGESLTAFWADYINFPVVHFACTRLENSPSGYFKDELASG